MNKLIKTDFHGDIMQFRNDGWFNATVAAAKFDKEPYDWLNQRDTVEYIAAFADKKTNSCFLKEFNEINKLDGASAASKAKLIRLAKKTGFVKAKSGSINNGGGTWLHPKLAIVFARWLSVDFAIWCDEQIDAIIHGTPEKTDWSRVRHEAAASYKVMSAMLDMKRQLEGKQTKSHHYANEAKLVNYALTGEFKSVDRSELDRDSLDILAKLEELNTLLIGQGFDREQRKERLVQCVANMRTLALQ